MDASIMLIDPKAKTMIWSGEAGDRDLWKGGWARGKQRKVAARLVKKLKGEWKKDLKRIRKGK